MKSISANLSASVPDPLKWKDELPSEFTVYFKTENNQAVWQYSSPEIEGAGNLSISFTGLDSAPFIKKSQEGRSFTLKIDLDDLKPQNDGIISFKVTADDGTG